MDERKFSPQVMTAIENFANLYPQFQFETIESIYRELGANPYMCDEDAFTKAYLSEFILLLSCAVNATLLTLDGKSPQLEKLTEKHIFPLHDSWARLIEIYTINEEDFDDGEFDDDYEESTHAHAEAFDIPLPGKKVNEVVEVFDEGETVNDEYPKANSFFMERPKNVARFIRHLRKTTFIDLAKQLSQKLESFFNDSIVDLALTASEQKELISTITETLFHYAFNEDGDPSISDSVGMNFSIILSEARIP